MYPTSIGANMTSANGVAMAIRTVMTTRHRVVR